MKRVLVTGVNGFIGRHLADKLQEQQEQQWHVVSLARDQAGPEMLSVGHEDSTAAWSRALEGIDAVVHLAGIAHRHAAPEAYQAINADWPVRLFESAVAAGVRVFIHLSSIKVLGDTSTSPLPVDAPYHPVGPYAESKRSAEEGLLALAGPGLSPTILRPPLVYGPGVRANFAALLTLARLGQRGLPLPLGSACAPRSIVSTTNLCALLVKLLEGTPGVFHIHDGRDWSVAELLRLWQVPDQRLWRIKPASAARIARLIGKQGTFERLFQPLQVDQSATLANINWRPEADTTRELNDTFAWYLNNR